LERFVVYQNTDRLSDSKSKSIISRALGLALGRIRGKRDLIEG
jgi:hypothetical protein